MNKKEKIIKDKWEKKKQRMSKQILKDKVSKMTPVDKEIYYK